MLAIVSRLPESRVPALFHIDITDGQGGRHRHGDGQEDGRCFSLHEPQGNYLLPLPDCFVYVSRYVQYTTAGGEKFDASVNRL